jgi:hypothetical protein
MIKLGILRNSKLVRFSQIIEKLKTINLTVIQKELFNCVKLFVLLNFKKCNVKVREEVKIFEVHLFGI